MFQMLNPFIADLHHLQKCLLCNTSNIFALFRTLKKNDIQNPFNSKGVGSGIYELFSETQTESQVSAFTPESFMLSLHSGCLSGLLVV